MIWMLDPELVFAVWCLLVTNSWYISEISCCGGLWRWILGSICVFFACIYFLSVLYLDFAFTAAILLVRKETILFFLFAGVGGALASVSSVFVHFGWNLKSDLHFSICLWIWRITLEQGDDGLGNLNFYSLFGWLCRYSAALGIRAVR